MIFIIFRYNLFDDIKLMTSQVKSSEVLVSLTKKSLERWSNLLEWKRENVKLDFSRACDSEDETDSEAETEPPQEPLFCRDDVRFFSSFFLFVVRLLLFYL